MLQFNTFELQQEDVALTDIPGLSSNPSQSQVIARAAIIGNFPPRQCGLATFTRDMYACLSQALPKARWNVIAMNDPGASYDYPLDVTHQVPQQDAAAYRDLADELNRNGTQVLFVQHEFGIYGGPSGAYLLDGLERLTMPIVTTLHTILEAPNDEQLQVMKGLIRLSSTLVTMAHKGADILKRVYGVPESQISVIPHGAPYRPMKDTSEFKAAYGLQGRKTLTTFGLLSPNKGIETIIDAIPRILETCPDAIYLVIGATHPHLLRDNGEAYRDTLKARARELGVEDSIRFVDQFMGDDDLIDMLQATDVYVTPYLTQTQITSGTLSYALALGRPVVSTPYWHAVEALANGVGIVCPFHDSEAFATAISGLLTSDRARNAMSLRAHVSALSSRWSAVAQAYVAKARTDIETKNAEPHPNASPLTMNLLKMKPRAAAGAAPATTAVERMSDNCGIFQHGKYRVADRQHGYCADDNCRALSLVARRSLVANTPPGHLDAYVYASFMNHAWNPDTGRFRNFMSYGRAWLDEGGSDDCCARSFESLADVACSNLPDDLRQWATELGQRLIASAAGWTSVRSRATMVRALVRIHGRLGNPREVEGLIRQFAHDLHASFKTHSRHDHVWFEPKLSYDNARLAEALIVAGQFLEDETMLRSGLSALRWLMQHQTLPNKPHFLPVPTSRFCSDGQRHPLFDQQPLEVQASIEACLTAFEVSGEPHWRDEALRAFGWFHGDNSQGLPLVTEDGGCFDGLTPEGRNANQGAESILAYHLSWTALANAS